MARSWNRASRAFTFPETLVTLALLVLSAGLATQLLYSSLVFHQAHDASQKSLRSLIELKTGLITLTSQIRPPSWANPEAFQKGDSGLTIPYWKGGGNALVHLSVDAQGMVRWSGPELDLAWGPWLGASVQFWEVDHRVLGVQIDLPQGAKTTTLKFPWGGWPL